MRAYSFRTIQNPSEGIYKEKGSKFLAFAFPVENEADIKEKLDSVKKKYFDARHHCYAWILGSDKNKSRAFDDGEPNHSAGDPILGQIRSKDLTNILIVVVRYFGGVKLGVGGLVSAYKAAALDALSKALTLEREIVDSVRLSFPYANTPEVMKLVKQFDLRVISQSFHEHCVIELELPVKVKTLFLERLTLLQSLGNSIVQE